MGRGSFDCSFNSSLFLPLATWEMATAVYLHIYIKGYYLITAGTLEWSPKGILTGQGTDMECNHFLPPYPLNFSSRGMVVFSHFRTHYPGIGPNTPLLQYERTMPRTDNPLKEMKLVRLKITDEGFRNPFFFKKCPLSFLFHISNQAHSLVSSCQCPLADQRRR